MSDNKKLSLTKPSEIIAKMEDLLRDPKCWTKRSNARNALGMHVKATDADAVCWCEIGAIIRCLPPAPSPGQDAVGLKVERILRDEVPLGRPVHCYNDAESTTHADIMAHLARAKQRALELEAFT